MKIRTSYTFNSNSFLLSCFSNVLECCNCARWDLTVKLNFTAHFRSTLIFGDRFQKVNTQILKH